MFIQSLKDEMRKVGKATLPVALNFFYGFIFMFIAIGLGRVFDYFGYERLSGQVIVDTFIAVFAPGLLLLVLAVVLTILMPLQFLHQSLRRISRRAGDFAEAILTNFIFLTGSMFGAILAAGAFYQEVENLAGFMALAGCVLVTLCMLKVTHDVVVHEQVGRTKYWMQVIGIIALYGMSIHLILLTE